MIDLTPQIIQLQIVTALVLIAVSLVVIAFGKLERTKGRR